MHRSPRLRFWITATACAAAAFLPTKFVNAQSTVPVGYLKFTLPTTTVETRTTLNFPLGTAVSYSGPVASVAADTISVTGTPFVANALVTTPSFVRFLSGAQAGRAIRVLANTANTITLDTTDNSPQTVPLDLAGFSVAATDRFEVTAASTLGSIFGGITGKSLLLVGNSTESLADQVALYNSRTLAWEYFYYNSGLARWVRSGSNVDASTTLIEPDDAVLIVRRAGRTAAVDLIVTGAVPAVKPLTKVVGSSQARYASTRYPVPVTLSQLNLGVDWKTATNVFLADTITLWNATTSSWDVYFKRPDSGWRRSGDNTTEQASFTIPTGAVVGYLKRANLSGAASFVSAPMPYSL